jgi:hypothetical protein
VADRYGSVVVAGYCNYGDLELAGVAAACDDWLGVPTL